MMDHVAEALARRPERMRAQANRSAYISLLVAPVQDIEDALQQLLTQRSLDTAIGAQLDMLGALVGQVRISSDDGVQRRYVRARIAANRSRGTVEDLIRISPLVVDDVAASYVVERWAVASVIVRVEDVAVADEVATILAEYLRVAVGAGVRVILESSSAVPLGTFRGASPCTFLNGAHAAGVYTLNVDSTTGFAATGALRISTGTTMYEIVSYVGKNATSFTLRSVFPGSPLANNQDDRAAIQFEDNADTTGAATAAFLGGVHAAGSPTLPVDSTTEFPASGTLTLSAGTATAEDVTYTGKGATTFTGVSATVFEQPTNAATSMLSARLTA